MKFFLWLGNRTQAARDFMKGWDKTVCFELDETRYFSVQVKGGKASYHEGKPEKYDVLLKATSKVLNEVLSGKTGMEEAFTEHQFEVIGPIVDGVKFRHLSTLIEEEHGRMFSILRGLLNIL